jgi:hypothetical protein
LDFLQRQRFPALVMIEQDLTPANNPVSRAVALEAQTGFAQAQAR